jgi:hypothetical protein
VSFAVEATFSAICGLGGAYAVFNEQCWHSWKARALAAIQLEKTR